MGGDKEYTSVWYVSVGSVWAKWPAQEKRGYDSTEGLGSQETEKNADEPMVRAPQGGEEEAKT